MDCEVDVIEAEAAEARVLAELSRIKADLIAARQLPLYAEYGAEYEQSRRQYAVRLQALGATHKARKIQRERRRSALRTQLEGDALAQALRGLERESQQDSRERRSLKAARSHVLEPLACAIAQHEEKIRFLQQQYASLSQSWQAQVQAAYFDGIISADVEPLEVLYEDADLIVVDKPAGLLSVPGRLLHLQDCVIHRLQYQRYGKHYKRHFLQAAHRLDRDTSGVMVIAKTSAAHASVSQQFAQRQVQKVYQALLSEPIRKRRGVIDLPLRSHLEQRPKQLVDFEQGKPSQTRYECVEQDMERDIEQGTEQGRKQGKRTRVMFTPITGRTHQIRVHAAHPQGLNSPIVGDVLYGEKKQNGEGKQNSEEKQRDWNNEQRLCLHAEQIVLKQPSTLQVLKVVSPVPF